MDNYDELRDQFKAMRQERSISGNDIQTGGHVYNFENGKSFPSLKKFVGWLQKMNLKLKIVKNG